MSKNLTQAKAHPAVHPSLAAAIGYCFGGQCCLDMVRNGDDLQGVVSLHGLLQSEKTLIGVVLGSFLFSTYCSPPPYFMIVRGG